MSESFQRQIVLKMQDGTTSGGQHLCASCASALVRRGLNGREDLQVCGPISQMTGGRRGVIDGPVARCSHYYPKNLPQLHELREIAWEISINGRNIGFITPEDRRRAGIGFGMPAPAAPPW